MSPVQRLLANRVTALFEGKGSAQVKGLVGEENRSPIPDSSKIENLIGPRARTSGHYTLRRYLYNKTNLIFLSELYILVSLTIRICVPTMSKARYVCCYKL